MLEIRNLGVRYGRHLALDGVSASVGKGEICVVLGANGAGKSSLLKAVAGMVATAPGSEVIMNGRSLVGMKPHRIVEEGIALVPEGRGIFGDLTVAENLSLGAFARRARSREVATLERIYETFPRLAERKRQVARTMSGGEQQMVAIGRALMSNPEILMLDEPSLGLSPLLTKDMFRSLSAIAATGVGILLVEQNARQSLRIAGRGYLIENGAIAGENSAEALMSDPAVINAYLGGAAARPAAAPSRMNLPRPFGLPAGAAAIGRFVGDLAGRAQRIQSAFVRQLRRDGGLPSAFVGRYDPKAGGDPWENVDLQSAPSLAAGPRIAPEALNVAGRSAALASRATDRLAAHIRSSRLSAPTPSAFLRRDEAPAAEAALALPNGAYGRIGHNSAGQDIDEAAAEVIDRVATEVVELVDDTPPPPAISIADLAARAATIHAAHVAQRRKTLSVFVVPAARPSEEAPPKSRKSPKTKKRKKH